MKLWELFLALVALFALEGRDGENIGESGITCGKRSKDARLNETHSNVCWTRSKRNMESDNQCIVAYEVCNEFSRGTACCVGDVENRVEVNA